MTGLFAAFCTVIGIWFLGFGLWMHDWRVILAAVILMFLGPMVGTEARNEREERRVRERLDALWGLDEDD